MANPKLRDASMAEASCTSACRLSCVFRQAPAAQCGRVEQMARSQYKDWFHDSYGADYGSFDGDNRLTSFVL
jgi:hypothetical protein